MKRIFIWMLVMMMSIAMIVTFSLVGCKKEEVAEPAIEEEAVEETPAEEEVAEKEVTEEEVQISKIGYSPLTSQMEYFQRVILGVESKCNEYGIELLIDDPQLDLNKQVTGLENLLTAGAEALIICSLDPVAVESIVDEAHSKGIPVVSHVSVFENADCYVGLNEYEFGLSGGEAFGKELQEVLGEKEIKMAILSADVLGEGLVQRVKGEIEGILKYYPNAEEVAKSDAFDEPTALTTVETMLQANPDINVIVCCNDPGAYGAIDAIEGAGLTLNKDIFICCLGDQFKTLDLIEEGKILSSVTVAPEACGEVMVEVAIKLIKGEDVDLDVYTSFEPVTEENVSEVRDFKLSFGPIE